MASLIRSAFEYMGLSQEKKPSDTTSQAKNSAGRAGSHATDEIEDDEVQEVSERAAASSNKRTRDLDAQYLPPSKRRAAEAQRLTGNYHIPKTATPILVTGPTEACTPGHTTPRPTSRMGGAFKPIDTLGQLKHSPKPRQSTVYQGTNLRHPVTKPSKPQTASKAGRNVTDKPFTVRGDGFHSGWTEPPKKKQKASNGIAFSDPVDLTDEHEQEPQEKMLEVVSPVPKRSGKFEGAGPFGGTSEFVAADRTLHDAPKKKSGKPANGPRSSQASSRSPSVLGTGSGKSHLDVGTRQSPVSIEDDAAYAQPTRVEKIRRDIPQTVPIDLGRGLDKVGPRFPQKPNAAEPALGNDVMHRIVSHRHENRQTTQSEVTASQATPQLRSGAPEGSSDWYAAHGRAQGAQSPRLNRQFVRDSEEPRQTARQRMKASSTRVSPTHYGDSTSSPDELHGGTTVRSQASRSASPQKRQVTANQGQPRQRGSLPSNLVPTRLTQGGKRSLPKQTSPQHRSPLDDVRMPIMAFYSASCVLTSGDLSLTYDEEHKEMDLNKDRVPMPIPGMHQVVHVGKSEVQKVFYSNDNPRVHITGSATDVSHGHICIAFKSYDGVRWCLERLGHATDNRITLNHTIPERLDRIFAQQARVIAERAEKQARMRTAAALDPGPQDDSEQILYEDTEPVRERRPKLRTNMRDHDGGEEDDMDRRPNKTLETVTSKFFDHPPRRSTRALKPTQQRPPTPPPPQRWTEIHKPKRWPHPVVYPPQGTRRATVEFDDLERLDEGQFLNDNVVSFALRQIEENMAPEHKPSVHFFNSFFYESLANKNGRKELNYDAVKRWTKNTDIFNFPYIVVPICIDLHWFVAIICNLHNLSRKPAVDDEEHTSVKEEDEMLEVVDAAEHEAGDVIEDSQDAMEVEKSTREVRESQEGIHNLSIHDNGEVTSDRDVFALENNGQATNALADENEIEQVQGAHLGASKSKKSKKKALPALRKYDTELPSIITLDSFGSSHTTEVRFLKDYLRKEADEKRGMELERDQLQGITAKGIPEQTNFCDCGVYLIGYIEEFAKDPKKFVDKVLNRQLDQQADFASFNPSAKRGSIREELLKLQTQQDDERKAKKKQKAQAQKPGGPATSPAPQKDVVEHSKSLAPEPANAEASEATPSTQEASLVEINDPAPGQASVVELRRIATMHQSDDVGDGEELETAPAVPLGLPTRRPTAQHLPEPETQRSSFSEDEMLDGSDQRGDENGALANAEVSQPLDVLENILEEGPAWTSSTAAAEATSLSASEAEALHGSASGSSDHEKAPANGKAERVGPSRVPIHAIGLTS